MKLPASAGNAPAEPAMAAPTPAPAAPPTEDLDFGGESQTEPIEPETTEAPANDNPFDKEPFDAGIDVDEESDPKKFIEKLSGKIGQSLRDYTKAQGQPDFELEKFAINSLVSATHTSEMDENDRDDIIKKINTAGENDAENPDMGDDNNDANSGDDNNDGAGTDFGGDAEAGMEETRLFEDDNIFLEQPKRMSMFAPEGSPEFMEQNRINESCWKGYKKDGMKTMFGKKYPNCVKVSENEIIEEGSGSILEETDDYVIYEVIEEGKKKKKKTKKDACYHKVKSRYDVWPSAYASGALVKCRNVGAANWGNSTDESEEPIEEKWSEDYKKSIDCNNPKGFSQKAHCDARKKRQKGEETKSKPVNENISEISGIVNQYMENTEYDIQNSLGNCSFFTRDMLNWAKKNGIKADYVYMPMSEQYRKENNISDSEWEDHIVPMINGVIIDFAYTPQGVSKNVRTSNTIPPKLFNYNDNLFKPNGVYGKFGYTKPEINTEYGNPKNINSFNVVEPNNKKEDLSELKIYESIDKIAGVWDTNEKFEDGSDFKIKFKVSDVIELAKNSPVKNIDPKKINYDFSGRQEDPTKTKDRVNKADLSYPIIVVKNENGKIFAMLDGTHRLEKALSLGLDSIEVKILNKEDLIQFKTNSLDEAKKTDFSKEKKSGLHGWFSHRGDAWVDCNTCRDGKCKPCGRKEGEHRDYPACRPTPASCKAKGRGESWGKKSANESELTVYENYEGGESNNYMFWLNLKGIHDDVIEILNMDNSKVDALIANGHQWALEHVITSKDDVEEVYHFLEGNLESDNVMEGEHESNNYMFWSSLKTIAHASGELLKMDENKVDALLSDGHGWALDHLATSNDDIEEVYHFLANALDAYNGDTEGGYEDEHGSVENVDMTEGKYDGKKLGKPTHGDVKKFKVYVKNAKGNVIKVNFGDPNMEIKRDNPKRRKSFRARHKCAQAKDRTTPKYWSCKMWSKTPVSKIVGENLINLENFSIFDKNIIKLKLQETFNHEIMSEPLVEPIVKPTTKPAEPAPSRRNRPFTIEPDTIPQTDPKAINEGKFDYETYHKTLSSTLDEVREYVLKRGFDNVEFSMNDVQHVAYGHTERFSKELTKNNKPLRQTINVQIYRMDSGTYELNMYIA